MATIVFSKKMDLNDQYDVIVAGGGPAGCAAAAAAGREGARVLLLETTGALGGMGTSGLVPAWAPTTDGTKIIYRGLAEKIVSQCAKHLAYTSDDDRSWVAIDPEFLKRLYDDLMLENNVDVLFNTMLCGVNAEGGGITSIIVSNKSGLSAYAAHVYIDCTGDGDLACWAGAEYEQGDEEQKVQATTLCFTLSNVDSYGYEHGPWLHPGNPDSPIYRILEEGKYPQIPDRHLCNHMVGPGVVTFNAGHVWDVDNTKPQTVSRALAEGRKIAHAIHQALAEYAPKGFANSHLTATAPLLGVRETRRIIGDYYLTGDDLRNMASFADEIGRNCYYVDVHSSKKENSSKSKGKGKGTGFKFPDGASHGIPYRCLTPKRLRNVLVAGRAVSTDRAANGSMRVMPTCLVTGEAAGVAAVQARNGNSDVHAVDTDVLRATLRKHDVYLP